MRCKLLLVFVLIIGISFVSAEDLNLTQQQLAEKCLLNSRVEIDGLGEYNISSVRFEDIYARASVLYDAQIIISERKGNADFSQVISYCNQISDLKETAISALDFYAVFLDFYAEAVDVNADSSSIDEIVRQIEDEFSGERYENVEQLIDTGYTEISRVKAEQTTLVLAYKATTRNLRDFFVENWRSVLIGIAVVLFIYLIYRTKIIRWKLERRLNKLLFRKETLKNLMGETQKEYFQMGKISESDYRVRIKNFADLTRDIDRQIPMLQKELIDMGKRIDIDGSLAREMSVKKKIYNPDYSRLVQSGKHESGHRKILHKKHVVKPRKKAIKKKRR